MTQKQGKFFVIDGTDGSGKQTQTKLLIERLAKEGHDVSSIAFPRYGQKSAGLVEEYLAGEYGTAEEVGPRTASMFYALDRYAAQFDIRKRLQAGQTVVADRYVSANMGHQGGKLNDPKDREDFFRWNEELEYETLGIPRPDLTVILHVPAEIGQQLSDKRDAGKKDIHQQDIAHLKNAEEIYLKMAELFPQIVLVECCPNGELMTREEIHEQVWRQVKPLLERQAAEKEKGALLERQ